VSAVVMPIVAVCLHMNKVYYYLACWFCS